MRLPDLPIVSPFRPAYSNYESVPEDAFFTSVQYSGAFGQYLWLDRLSWLDVNGNLPAGIADDKPEDGSFVCWGVIVDGTRRENTPLHFGEETSRLADLRSGCPSIYTVRKKKSPDTNAAFIGTNSHTDAYSTLFDESKCCLYFCVYLLVYSRDQARMTVAIQRPSLMPVEPPEPPGLCLCCCCSSLSTSCMLHTWCPPPP